MKKQSQKIYYYRDNLERALKKPELQDLLSYNNQVPFANRIAILLHLSSFAGHWPMLEVDNLLSENVYFIDLNRRSDFFQDIPSGNDRMLDRLSDVMTFGALLPCPVRTKSKQSTSFYIDV